MLTDQEIIEEKEITTGITIEIETEIEMIDMVIVTTIAIGEMLEIHILPLTKGDRITIESNLTTVGMQHLIKGLLKQQISLNSTSNCNSVAHLTFIILSLCHLISNSLPTFLDSRPILPKRLV
jgi:hypothetical protein